MRIPYFLRSARYKNQVFVRELKAALPSSNQNAWLLELVRKMPYVHSKQALLTRLEDNHLSLRVHRKVVNWLAEEGPRKQQELEFVNELIHAIEDSHRAVLEAELPKHKWNEPTEFRRK